MQSEAGTDAEQRSDARRAYEKEIHDAAGRARRNVRNAWARVRDRYGTPAGVTLDAIKRLVDKFNPHHHPAGGPQGRSGETGKYKLN
jgi:hypothetical protein